MNLKNLTLNVFREDDSLSVKIPKEPTTPLWKVDIPLMFLTFSLIVSPIVLLLWGIELLGAYHDNEFLISILPLLLLGLYFSQIIPFTLLSLHRRKLYGESSTGLREMYLHNRTMCLICKRHPVSKGYHLKHVHNLKNFKKKDYFKNCGCRICIQPDDDI
jgi:hypothetical protein